MNDSNHINHTNSCDCDCDCDCIDLPNLTSVSIGRKAFQYCQNVTIQSKYTLLNTCAHIHTTAAKGLILIL